VNHLELPDPHRRDPHEQIGPGPHRGIRAVPVSRGAYP
jgi:hypothetical protein